MLVRIYWAIKKRYTISATPWWNWNNWNWKLIRMLSAQEIWSSRKLPAQHTQQYPGSKEERVVAELEYENELYKVVIQKNEERNFDTSCPCQSDTAHPLCVTQDIVLLQLLHNYGPNYFDSIRNWDKEKNKLLALYGYSLTDDLKGKFEFTYTDGKPFLRVLDTSIKRVSIESCSGSAPQTGWSGICNSTGYCGRRGTV